MPEIPVAALYDGMPLCGFDEAVGLGAECVNLSCEFADAATVAQARALGLEVLIYTVNEPDEIHHWKAAGARGVFTDFPERRP